MRLRDELSITAKSRLVIRPSNIALLVAFARDPALSKPGKALIKWLRVQTR